MGKDKASIESLELEINRLKKINKALMDRAERGIAGRGGAFAIFEGNILLSNQVKERTQQLEMLTSAVASEKNKLSKIIHSLPGAILIFNRSHEVIEAFDGRAGSGKLIGPAKKLEDLFEGKLLRQMEFSLRKIATTKDAAHFDFTHKSEGLESHFACSVSAINEDHTVLYIQDSTEKVKNEKTIQNQRAQIIQASRLSALGEMAGGIAHEINTPLGTINILAGQIKKNLEKPGADIPAVIAIADKVQETVKRISTIVRSLRQISRDGTSDQVTPCKLGDIIGDALDVCRQRFQSHQIEFKTEYSEQIMVKAQRIQISQVILNLLSNSFHVASSQKEGWIHLLCEEFEDSVRIRVKDSGPGIDKKILEKVFDPFFTTKEVGEGTGLGLSIAQQIVRSHGSEIKYELLDGHTSFYFDVKKDTENCLAERKGVV